MYSPFPLISILAFFLGTFLVLVAAQDPKSLTGNGYDCSNVHIAVDRLQEAVATAKASQNPEEIARNMYSGPPFIKKYLLWPVSPDANTQGRVINSPYRVVLDDEFNVFSVVIKSGFGVVECRMKEDLISASVPAIMISPDDRISYNMLADAKRAACPKIRIASNQRFPARYDGNLFKHNGLQRYMFPILLDGREWGNNEEPGQYFMVMNSECVLLGAVSYRRQHEVAHVRFEYEVTYRN